MSPNFPVIDGFSYMKDFRCDLQFLSLAIDQYDALRRAGFYRQKQWVFPKNPNTQPVPAFGSQEHELRVGIGAVIWGYILWLPDNANGYSSIQVRDVCDDCAIFSEYAVLSNGNWPATRNNQGNGEGQIFLTKPYIVGKPGIVTVEITSQSSEPVAAQLVLFGGTPVNT